MILFFGYITAEMWYGPATAISQDLVPPSLRGLGTAIYFVASNFGALAPLLVGWLNERFDRPAAHSDEDDDGHKPLDPTYSLMIVVLGSYTIAAFGFVLTGWLIGYHRRRMARLLATSRFKNLISKVEAEAFLRPASDGRHADASLAPSVEEDDGKHREDTPLVFPTSNV